MVELVYTADLKSAGLGIEGSSPSTRTTALLGQLKELIVEQDITKLALLLAAQMQQEGAQRVPYSTLQHLASLCEVEMLNRAMPECAYAEEML